MAYHFALSQDALCHSDIGTEVPATRSTGSIPYIDSRRPRGPPTYCVRAQRLDTPSSRETLPFYCGSTPSEAFPRVRAGYGDSRGLLQTTYSPRTAAPPWLIPPVFDTAKQWRIDTGGLDAARYVFYGTCHLLFSCVVPAPSLVECEPSALRVFSVVLLSNSARWLIGSRSTIGCQVSPLENDGPLNPALS